VAARILIVEDDPITSTGLRRNLVAERHSVREAGSCIEAKRLLAEQHPDVVILDLSLPDGSGLDLVTAIHAIDRRIGIVVLTGSEASGDMREALRRGASSYLRKPADPLTVEAQVSIALARARATHVAQEAAPIAAEGVSALLERLPFSFATQISHAWDLRHIETGAHVRRMSEFTRRLALELGHSDSEATRLGRVAMLHDIGKIAIPDAILTKPGKLTGQELAIMKRHSEIGGELLAGTGHPMLDLASRVARSHHERWDGSGYPDGLVGDACLREARIVAVADVYDALCQTRCYKDAWSRQQVTEFFRGERGKRFEAELVDALLDLIPELELVKTEHPDPL
jgi:putative two-component system response regulator